MPDSTITLRTRAELSGVQQAVTAYNQLDAAQQKLAKDATTAAQNVARLDAALKGPIGAADSLKQHLQNAVAINPQQAVSAINQIIALEKKAEAEALNLAKANSGLGTAGGLPILPRTVEAFGTQAIDQFKSSLLGIVGPAALVTTALAAIPKAIDLAQAGLELRETENALKSIAGDQQTYDTIIAEAHKQQVLFGGSLQENVDGLSGLAVTSRITGARLSSLVDIQKRLSVLNPAQGAKGGLIALNEALAGNVASLSRRFNIPRAELAKLQDTAIPVAERIKILDEFLDRVGITSEAVTQKVDRTAVAFRQLGANVSNFTQERAAAGADALRPAVEAINAVADVGKGTSESIGGAVAGLTTLGSTLRGLPPPTDDAIQSNQRFATQLLTFIGVTTNAQQEIRKTNAAISGAFDEDRSAVGLQQLIDQAVRVGGAFDEDRQKLGQLQGVLGASEGDIQKNAKASAVDAAQKELQAAATKKTAEETNKAADAFIALNPNLDASEAFAAAAAAGLDPLIARIIALRVETNLTKQSLGDQLLKGQSENTQVLTGKGSALSPAFAGSANNSVDAVVALQEANKKAADQATRDNAALLDSEIAIANAKKDTGREIDLLRQKQAGIDKSTKAGQAEFNQIQAQIIGIQEGKKGGAAGGKGLGALDRVDISLAGDYQAQLDAVNAKLAAGHLTELQTKQLKKEQLDLQNKIAEATERSTNAALDARIAAIEDHKARRQEANQLAGAQRRLASGEFTPEEKAAAQDVIDLIPLQQEKRTRDIAAKAREGGIDVAAPPSPPPGAAAPSPGGAPTPPASLPTGAAAPAPIIIEVDGREIGRIAARFLQGGRQAAALRG